MNKVYVGCAKVVVQKCKRGELQFVNFLKLGRDYRGGEGGLSLKCEESARKWGPKSKKV